MKSAIKPAIQQLNKKIIRSTPLGSVCLVWRELNKNPVIVNVLFSRPGSKAEQRALALFPCSGKSSCAEIDAIASLIKADLEGERVKFPFNLLDLSGCTKFQLSVLRAQYAIPRGFVSTYGLVAAYVGVPGGARAVGNIMAGNPFPVIVPCHRTILSSFHIGGFQSGVEMKRAMLEREGIIFDKAGRVICGQLYYDRKL